MFFLSPIERIRGYSCQPCVRRRYIIVRSSYIHCDTLILFGRDVGQVQKLLRVLPLMSCLGIMLVRAITPIRFEIFRQCL